VVVTAGSDRLNFRVGAAPVLREAAAA
jgi:hypothetical protein